MKKIYLDKDIKIADECAVAIGKFDGIHLGHIKLLRRLLDFKSRGLKTVVFTFEKSLSSFFTGIPESNLMSEEEKDEFLSELGIDICAVYPVNADSVAVPPDDFIDDYLVSALNAKVIVAGPDLSYGDKGLGDFNLLREHSKGRYECIEIDKEIENSTGREISSTYVREVVALGDMELAGSLLGRPYSVYGKVEHGRKLGRVLQFPTVNLLPLSDKLLPPYGVYLANVVVGSELYKGVANVGIKPTISDHEAVCVETHILDFDDDLYGENIRVELLSFMRPEQKFESIDKLKEQLGKDIAAAREMEL